MRLALHLAVYACLFYSMVEWESVSGFTPAPAARPSQVSQVKHIPTSQSWRHQSLWTSSAIDTELDTVAASRVNVRRKYETFLWHDYNINYRVIFGINFLRW